MPNSYFKPVHDLLALVNISYNNNRDITRHALPSDSSEPFSLTLHTHHYRDASTGYQLVGHDGELLTPILRVREMQALLKGMCMALGLGVKLFFRKQEREGK